MLWLKHIDPVAAYLPRRLAPRSRNAVRPGSTCIVRPGGLGDLVLLTKACIAIGRNPQSFHWIVEKRNAPWAQYLALSHSCYDRFLSFSQVLVGKFAFSHVINSEQTFGLSMLFARRLTAIEGTLTGFQSNMRADLCDKAVPYLGPNEPEEQAFSRLLQAGLPAQGPSECQYLDSLTDHTSNSRPYVVVAVGGRHLPEKRMAIPAWRQLLSLASELKNEILLVGLPADCTFAEQILAGHNVPVQNLVGKLTFPEVVSTIRGSTRLFGIDGGLIHVADFFSVPSTAVFFTNLTTKWGPKTPGSTTVRAESLTD